MLNPEGCVVWLLEKFRYGKFSGDGFFPLDLEYTWWCVFMFERCREELEWLNPVKD